MCYRRNRINVNAQDFFINLLLTQIYLIDVGYDRNLNFGQLKGSLKCAIKMNNGTAYGSSIKPHNTKSFIRHSTVSKTWERENKQILAKKKANSATPFKWTVTRLTHYPQWPQAGKCLFNVQTERISIVFNVTCDRIPVFGSIFVFLNPG